MNTRPSLIIRNDWNLYQSVKCLDDYFRHLEELQWQKEIEPDMAEDEVFGMKM